MKTSTGNHSTGHRSTGNYSTGYWSTGHYSTGSCSTGDYSTGDRSTGDYSTGHWSTGHYSTGHRSTGDWSISNYSTGHFSTEDYTGFGCFDKPCTVQEWKVSYKPRFLFFDLTEWINEEDMTDQEKEDHPSYKTTDGYLKVYDYKEAFKRSWDSRDLKDNLRIKDLPNFDEEKFYQISGIRVSDYEQSESEIITLNGKKYKLIEDE